MVKILFNIVRNQQQILCAAYSGNRVHWHCTDDTSTTCVPCPSLTFTDEPNGLTECFPCTVCDASRGLRVNKVCTRSSDTVCGPLERFYCIEKKKDCCTLAVQHSECSPGQYIKQAGTGSTDTVCAECTGDTYSNGSFSSCLPHTKCEALGFTETNPGTHSSDTKCGNPSTAVAIVASSIIVALIIILVIFFFIFKHIRKKKQSKSSGKCYSVIFSMRSIVVFFYNGIFYENSTINSGWVTFIIIHIHYILLHLNRFIIIINVDYSCAA
uniref:TNFR-Cys domain-containing protein n=1 Tax=Cyprinus carpio carpio TaxID=630221 RepID=A0A9J8ATJ4_CYPCA